MGDFNYLETAGKGKVVRVQSFKRLLGMMAALMMAFATFTACEKLDDGDNGIDELENGGDGGDGNGNGGTVAGMRIKTIVHTAGDEPVRFDYSYNSDGTTKQIDYYDASSKLVMRDLIDCNPDGTWATIEQTDLVYANTVLVLNHSYDTNKKPLTVAGPLTLEGEEIGFTAFDFKFENGRKISQHQVVTVMGTVAQELQSEFTYGANGRRTKTVVKPKTGAEVTYSRTYNPDGTLQKVTVSGGASYTMNFSWENGKKTVQMDDIWGW